MQVIHDQYTVPFGLQVQSNTVSSYNTMYNLNTKEKHFALQNESMVSPPLALPFSPALNIWNLLKILKHVSTNRRYIIQSQATRTNGEPLWNIPSWYVKPTE